MTRAARFSQSFLADELVLNAQLGGVAIAYELNFNYVTGHATFTARRGSAAAARALRVRAGTQPSPKAEAFGGPGCAARRGCSDWLFRVAEVRRDHEQHIAIVAGRAERV